MNLIGPFLLGALMLGDGALMRSHNPELFRRVMRFPLFYCVVWLAWVAAYLILVSPHDGLADQLLASGRRHPSIYITMFFYIFVFPLYALRRQRYLQEDPLRPAEYLEGDDRATRTYLGFEFFQVCMVGFYGSLVIEITLGTVYRLLHLNLPEIDEMMVSVFFTTILGFVIISRSAHRFSAKGFWENVGFARGVPWSRGVFGPIMMGIVFAGMAGLTVMRNAGRQPQTPMSETLQTAQSSDTIFIFVAWAWLVAPAFEEIIFRGYCFHIFRKTLGRKGAITLIALAFAVLHVPQYWGDWAAIAAVAATGLGLTLLRDWSGTTRASLIMHLTYNVGVTLIPAIIVTAQNPYYHQYSTQYSHLSVDQREELLRKNIAYNPEYSDAYNDLAWLYAEEKTNIEEGLRLINRALEMSPDNSAYKDTKAELLEVRGDYEEALSIRQDIVENSYSDDMVAQQRERIKELEEILAGDDAP